jgi:Zn-dependent protease with chaperone function
VQGLNPESYFSLNRLYFADPNHAGVYATKDMSKGSFFLKTTASKPGQSGIWHLAGASGKVYAQSRRNTTFLDSIHDLEHLERQSWTTNDFNGNKVEAPEAAMSVRDGKALITELDDFAKKEGVGVGDVYLIDGSHADARANAFVAGAGKKRVIGLYDTLFLGDHATQEENESPAPPSSADGGLNLQALSASLQKVDLSEEEEAPVYHNAATQAMSDQEIMSILAHELGHAKFHDVEQNMVVQAFTSFATFATLGWMVQSPVVALALGVLQPIGHVAMFAFDHIVGPVMDGGIKFMTDGITRKKEYVADAYAAGVSEGYATGLQTALAKLTVSSNQDPDEPWFYEMLHADHPTFANRWRGIEDVKKTLYINNQKPAAFNQEHLQPES